MLNSIFNGNLKIEVLLITVISSIILEIAKQSLSYTGKLEINFDVSLTMGIVFLILSAIFRYGSSLIKPEKPEK